jgi:replicative DNA helicase
MSKLEETIIDNLICNEEYSRAALPFIQKDYFESWTEQQLFKIISAFIETYNRLPTREVMSIAAEKLGGLTENQYKDIKDRVDNINWEKSDNLQYLLDETEKYCQDRAIYNAITESIQIITDEGKSNVGRGQIPNLLTDALSVSFDTHIGHDFIDNAEERYDFYHKQEARIPFDIDLLNKITKGGLPRKSLSVLMAESGLGKTLFMCHFAAANLIQNKNVLYITLEMSEERIAERIDANLLNVTCSELAEMPKEMYLKKMERLKEKVKGKLIIKEYPTTSASAAHFRHLLTELKLKKKFVPDIIYVDYINICASSKTKIGNNMGSYGYIKSIAEEIRALAVEFDVAIVSATQSNKSGYNSTDLDATNVAESIGLLHTLDLLLGIIGTEELENMNQIMIKQIKNRYNDVSYNRRFVLGIDRPRMRLYNVENSAQEDIHESGFDKNSEKSHDFSSLNF